MWKSIINSLNVESKLCPRIVEMSLLLLYYYYNSSWDDLSAVSQTMICLFAFANLCSLITLAPPHFSLHSLSMCKYPKPRLLSFSQRHLWTIQVYSSNCEDVTVRPLHVQSLKLHYCGENTWPCQPEWTLQFTGGVKGHISRCPQLDRAHANSNRIILLTNWAPGFLDLPLQLQQMFHEQL